MLVLGASGGVGLAAVELGKLAGARVIAAASTDEKLDLCKQYGADETINYSTEDLKKIDRVEMIDENLQTLSPKERVLKAINFDFYHYRNDLYQ